MVVFPTLSAARCAPLVTWNRRLLRLLPDLGRGLLALGALGVGATWAVWQWAPQRVDELDRWIIERYMAPHAEAFAAAERDLAADPDRGIAALETLLEQLADTEKNDRLEVIKRRALDLVTTHLLARGRNAEAAQWAATWSEFDPMDFRAPLVRAKAIGATPGREAEGLAILAGLFQRLPAARSVFQQYLAVLRARGDRAGAVAALARHLDTGMTPAWEPDTAGLLWEMFWDTGAGFGGDRKARLAPVWFGERTLRLPFTLPAGTVRLRLDLPAGEPLVVMAPRLLGDLGGAGRLSLQELPADLRELSRPRADLLASAGTADPYVIWRLARPLPAELRGVLEFEVLQPVPDHIVELLAAPELRALEAQLAQQADRFGAQALQALRRRALHGRHIVLAGPGDPAPLATGTAVAPECRDQAGPWTAALPASTGVQPRRLLLPALVGLQLQLECRIPGSEPLPWTPGQDVELDAGWLRIVGPAPTVFLPQDADARAGLHLSGVAR